MVISTPRLCLNGAVLEYLSVHDLAHEYEALLSRLYADPVICPRRFYDLLCKDTELLIFVMQEKQLLATVQGSLVAALPEHLVQVSNLVVHDDYEGNGYGRRVLEALLETAKERWSGLGNRALRAVATNRPERNNSGFYEKQGWYPLTSPGGETRLWQKDLWCATTS